MIAKPYCMQNEEKMKNLNNSEILLASIYIVIKFLAIFESFSPNTANMVNLKKFPKQLFVIGSENALSEKMQLQDLMIRQQQ